MPVRNDDLALNSQKIPPLSSWSTYASIAVATGILIGLGAMVDLKAIWHQIEASDKRYIALGGLVHYTTYLFRGMRWRRSLQHLSINQGKGKFSLLLFFYNFIDNLVPAKLGDVYGAHLARINFRIRRSTAMGSIVFLRLIDAWFILFLAFMAAYVLFLNNLPQSVIWGLMGGVGIVGGATFIILLFLLFRKAIPNWVPKKMQRMLQAFHIGMWPIPTELFPIAVLTGIIWALEALWVFFLAMAFGLNIGFAETLFLTMIPLLASAFPFTPSGAGAVEIALYHCLQLIGIATPIAGSMTVVNRLIDYWLHIGLGLLIWAFRRQIGLRTWRDLPVEDPMESVTAEISTRKEIYHEN